MDRVRRVDRSGLLRDHAPDDPQQLGEWKRVRLRILPGDAVARRVDGRDEPGAIPRRCGVVPEAGRRRLAASLTRVCVRVVTRYARLPTASITIGCRRLGRRAMVRRDCARNPRTHHLSQFRSRQAGGVGGRPSPSKAGIAAGPPTGAASIRAVEVEVPFAAGKHSRGGRGVPGRTASGVRPIGRGR